MEKLFDKIGDHFNNPEMSDRILVVKIRKDGWEKLEAARRVRSITKTDSQGANDDTISTISSNLQEKPDKTEENESAVNKEEQKFDTDESAPTAADDSFNLPSISDSRTVSSLSCDSGIGDASSSEAKKNIKSKKREESWIVVEDQEQESETMMNLDSVSTHLLTREEVDLDVTFSKLLIADIRYAHKAGAIGLTAVNSVEEGASASCSSQSTENSVIRTSEEDLTLADTVIREHQLYVHSFWLALNSSYFRSLFFSSGMKETKVKKVSFVGDEQTDLQTDLLSNVIITPSPSTQMLTSSRLVPIAC